MIGAPHNELGEEAGAALALKPGVTATPAGVRAFAREQMAPYRYRRRAARAWSAQGPYRQDPAPHGQPPEDLR